MVLLPEYNFDPFSGKSSYAHNSASGHISDCIKWFDKHLGLYLNNNEIKPYRDISQKIEQFKALHPEEKKLSSLMRDIIQVRNAFQHGHDIPENNKLFLEYKGNKLELTNELMQNFQNNYNAVYSWLVEKVNPKI